MKLFDYLHSIDWIEDVPDVVEHRSPVAQLASLLDLDLSVELADALGVTTSEHSIMPDDVAMMVQPSAQLDLACRDAKIKFSLALANWDRGRYRVIHGERLGVLLSQSGFGSVEKADERWQKTGRLMWSSTQEFIDTHFKRARMKVRMSSTAFRAHASNWSTPIQRLMHLDDILLKAKLRQTENLSAWLTKIAQARFQEKWQAQRPALETKEALEMLVEKHGRAGWMGTFFDELGCVYAQVLDMEIEACAVVATALGVHPAPN